MMRFRKNIAFLLSVIYVISLMTACAKSDDNDGRNDGIQLEDPVGVSVQYAVAAHRDMFEVDVYSSSVNPVVTEYSFAKGQNFKKFGVTPGEKVVPGDILAYSETKSLDTQVSDLEEEIADMESAHVIQMDGLNKDIYDAKKAEFEAREPYMETFGYEPDENEYPLFHEGWAAGQMYPEGAYKRAVQNRERLEQTQKQTQELFELERSYKLGNVQRLKDKISEATIQSTVTGEIVACNYFDSGDWIEKETPILAVGDTTQRVLQTEYIAKGKINKALDIYAIINGKRYELEYVNMDPEEYTQKNNAGESVYTTFILVDPANEIKIGTYAVVVVEKDRRNGVLCIPNDSIKKEADGYYTYLYDGTETKYVPVEIGMRDGLYAEVISGLSEGDKVLSTQVPKKTANTGTVTRGDYFVNTEINGYLYYPFSEWITNPSKSGSTYLKEVFVTNNQKVEKEQLLATLEVIPDQIEIDRLNRQISRLQTRLDKMNKKKYDYDARKIIDRGLERDIAEGNRTIDMYRRRLSKLGKYSGIVEIKAPFSGIVMKADMFKPGDLIAAEGNVIEMANDSLSYIILKDDKNQLNYGNDAQIKVSSTGGSSVINGRVVSVNKMCLSNKLTNDFSLIAIPQEEIASVAGTTMIEGGRWDRNSFKVNVKVRSEDNVLMIPKPAVTVKDKSTYVNVIKEDGSVERVSFIPGGSDPNYYWAIDGLTEGMTVCWE